MKNRIYKVIFVGPSDAGKTTICHEILHPKNGIKSRKPTVGAEFNTKIINNNKIGLWDTSGEEKYKSMTKIYFRNSDIGIFVKDITNHKRTSIETYLEYARECNIKYGIYIFNKMDLINLNEKEKKTIKKNAVEELKKHKFEKIKVLFKSAINEDANDIIALIDEYTRENKKKENKYIVQEQNCTC